MDAQTAVAPISSLSAWSRSAQRNGLRGGWNLGQVRRRPTQPSGHVHLAQRARFARPDVDGNRLDATFLQSTGVVRDTFTILKGSPSNIEVTPNLHAFAQWALGPKRSRHSRSGTGARRSGGHSQPGRRSGNEFAIRRAIRSSCSRPGRPQTIDVRFAPISRAPSPRCCV